MNVLVTGANGFIGKNLVKELISLNHNVFAVVSSKENMDDISCDNLTIIELKFDGYRRLSSIVKKNVDLAFHLAWSGLNNAEAKNVYIQQENVVATFELLMQLKLLNIKKFVFASSMNVLEVKKYMQDPVNRNPRGTYVHVLAKMSANIVARQFCFENSIEYNEALIAMVYGENNYSKMVTNIFISSLLRNVSPKMVSGNNLYDLIYIKDVAEGLVAIGTFGKDKKSYYVGHSWNRTFRDIFTEIRNIINPNIDIQFGAFPNDPCYDFNGIDRSELTKDCGWSPSFDFAKSILNTKEWVEKNIKLFE